MSEEQKEIKVLHVDDEPDFLALTKAFLEREYAEFSIDTATSAGEAVELLKSAKYDGVVSDYQMPVMDGLELLKTLRASGNTIPFIMFTGKGREEVAIEALNRGANHYLQKGTDIKSMYGTLAHVIKQEVKTKRAGDELVEVKKEQQIVLESVPAMIFHVDRDSNYIYANRRFADTFGLKPEDFKGKSTKAIFPEDTETYIKSDKEVVKSGVPKIRIINKLITPKGKRWLRTDKVPVKDADGNVTGVIGFGLDVTTRKKAEDELRNTNKQLRDTIEFLPDATFVIDRDKKVIAWNRAMEEMTGIPKEDIIGKGDYEYALPFYGIARPLLIDLIFLSDKEIEARYNYVKRKGNTLFAEVFISSMYGGKGAYLWGTATPLLDSEGNILGAIESIRDISERKAAEGRIERLNIVLRAIRNVNQLITKEKDRDRLIKGICDILVETRGYHNAWGALLDDAGRAVKTAEAGFGEEFLPMREQLKRGELPKCGRKALRQSDVVVTEDTATTCVDCPLSNDCRGEGAMTIRLKYGKKVYGLLSVSLPAEFTPEVEEQSLFEEVAGDIVFALYNMEQEEERKRAEEKLAKIVDGVGIPTFAINSEHKISHWNTAVESVTGVKREEVVGTDKQWIAFYATKRSVMADLIVDGAPESEFKDWYGDKYKKSSLIEGAYDALDFFLTLGGKWLLFTAAPLRDSEGTIIGAIETLQDITERKRTEEALRESEERYRLLFNSSNDAVFVHPKVIEGKPGKFIEVNDVACQKLGYTREELLQLSHLDIIAPEQLGNVPALREKLLEKKRNIFEIVAVTKDGGNIPLEISTHLFNLNGETAVLSIARDITKRKHAEDALRESEEEYRSLVESTEDSVYLVDRDCRYLFMNENHLSRIGMPKDQVIGKTHGELHSEDETEEFAKIVEEVFETEKSVQHEHRSRRDNRYILRTLSPVKDSEGRVTAVTVVSKDISELKRVAAELEAKNTELERFTYTVSHDLRSPLITIQGFTDMVQTDLERDEVEKAKENLTFIDKAAITMGNLLSATLQLSRAGRMMNPPEDVPFGAIVEDALEQTAAQIKSSGVEVSVAEDFPTVHVDQMRIAEVLVNLIGNSIRYMGDQPHPEIDIGYRVDGKETVFFVKDNGIGMDESQHEKVFELFYRVDASGEGSGAGLAIVKRMIEVHNGRIWIESEKGKGCTVCFILPVV